MKRMLTIDVRKQFFDKREASFDLELSVEIGSGFTVLTGPSGAGKTTLLKMISGIIRPDRGRIELDRKVFFESELRIDVPIRERQVGFVFQDYALFPHMTATENVCYGIKTGSSAERRDKALEMLALFHIEHIAARMPREMSGGEQQRVALARALASEPAIALLDEPLSAVDVETRGKLLDEVENAQERTGIPFIYVTHNEAEAARLGRQRITMRAGRIVEANVVAS
ncbi:MAG: ATP-binding cassette domain-containing protein [Acidobacteria bacterium ACB1]|nr:ATP-binding cassette domain-containing protein [Acidobacteria bacterium ACB1]RIJ96101.1 MAG: ABC transporter [Acidobacteriota bacterium]